MSLRVPCQPGAELRLTSLNLRPFGRYRLSFDTFIQNVSLVRGAMARPWMDIYHSHSLASSGGIRNFALLYACSSGSQLDPRQLAAIRNKIS